MKWKEPHSCSNFPDAAPKLERRREDRRPASGDLRLRFEDPLPTEVTGEILDVSDSGFRACHHSTALHNGQCVEFSYAEEEGTARVVWNRITADKVETGFLIVGRGC